MQVRSPNTRLTYLVPSVERDPFRGTTDELARQRLRLALALADAFSACVGPLRRPCPAAASPRGRAPLAGRGRGGAARTPRWCFVRGAQAAASF
jgi:hypothetical protein